MLIGRFNDAVISLTNDYLITINQNGMIKKHIPIIEYPLINDNTIFDEKIIDGSGSKLIRTTKYIWLISDNSCHTF